MTIRFITNGRPHGWGFDKNQVTSLPENLAKEAIELGLAIDVRYEKQYRASINQLAGEALQNAKDRDQPHRSLK